MVVTDLEYVAQHWSCPACPVLLAAGDTDTLAAAVERHTAGHELEDQAKPCL